MTLCFACRDRVPFVLTSDMVYVINGGDRPSMQFQEFVDLCCQAFNIIRKHGNLLLTLFMSVSENNDTKSGNLILYWYKSLYLFF